MARPTGLVSAPNQMKPVRDSSTGTSLAQRLEAVVYLALAENRGYPGFTF